MAFTNSTNSPRPTRSAKPSAIFPSTSKPRGLTPPRCEANESQKTPRFLKTPRKVSKTPGKKSAPISVGDRFIPVRKGADLDLNCFRALESLGDSEETQTDSNEIKSDFLRHVENQLLEKEDKILAFGSKPPKTEAVQENLKTLYSMNKVSVPKKMSRYIPQNAERVLDAPELIDDYYLNVLDWSNNNLISIALGSSLYLWNASTANVSQLFDMSVDGDEGDYVSSLSYDKSGHILAVGNSKHEVQLWDMAHKKRVRTMTGHVGRVSSLAWNGPFLTSGSISGNILHHDVRVSNHCVTKIPAHYGEVCGLKWSPDGRHLASGSNDNTIKIWAGNNVISTTPLHCLTNHVAAVKALAWCPWHSSLLASGAGTADRCIKFWNVVTGQCLNSVDTKSQVCGLLWSLEHRELVSGHGYSQNQLSIWKYPTMMKVCELVGHTGRILHMCCSPDSSVVASLGADETLRLWHCFQVNERKKASHAQKGGQSFGSRRNLSSMR